MTSNESQNKQSTVKIFKVHPDGRITGSQYAKPGDKLIVEYSSSNNHYAGKVYANHNGSNGSQRLVGSEEITIGVQYTIQEGAALPAAARPGVATTNYMITTTRPAGPGLQGATERGPAGQRSGHTPESTTSGTGDLYVGS